MNSTHRWLLTLVVIAAAGTSSPSMSAQVAVPNPDPWRVTVTPTLNPLAVGFCGAVHLTVFEGAGGEVPRNPTGFA